MRDTLPVPGQIQVLKVKGRRNESVLHCWSKIPWRLYLTCLLFALVCREVRVPFTIYRVQLDWTKSNNRTGHGSDRPSERVDAGQSTEQRSEVLCTSWCD